MTRIFDALKKSEAARQGGQGGAAPLTPLPAPLQHAPGGARPAGVPRPTLDPQRAPLPLLGQLELSEEIIREMTTLRVTLESALGDRSSRTLLFVSPQGGEGTSTVTLQYASALARDAAMRPLIIDGHVRRPAYSLDPTQRMAMLDPRLMPRGGPQPTVASNLFVVPPADECLRTGVFPPVALRQALETCTAGFDWVLVDGPPVLESPDSAPLASLVDGVVLVVQAGRTKRPVLTRAADLLRKAGARVLGSVLNRRVLEIPEFIYRRI